MSFDIQSLYHPSLQGEGLFVVIEGLDGVGKTLQTQALYEHLMMDMKGPKGAAPFPSIMSWKQPTTGEWGRKIRQYAAEVQQRMPLVEFSLFLVDRSEQASLLRSNVQLGNVVLMDRCYHTSVAYQSATGDLDPWEIYHSNRIVFPKPDLLILLDIDPKTAMERLTSRGGDKEVFEREDFLTKARKTYLELAERENSVVIDGSQSVEQVEQDIWGAFANLLLSRPERFANSEIHA